MDVAEAMIAAGASSRQQGHGRRRREVKAGKSGLYKELALAAGKEQKAGVAVREGSKYSAIVCLHTGQHAISYSSSFASFLLLTSYSVRTLSIEKKSPIEI